MGLLVANVAWSEYVQVLTGTTNNLFYYWKPDRTAQATAIVFPTNDPLGHSQGYYETGRGLSWLSNWATSTFRAKYPATWQVLEVTSLAGRC